MMVAFPIAFLYGGLLADILGHVFGSGSLYATGGYLSLAAVISGFAAGVPGLIDYIYIIPPHSSGAKRAFLHMIVNLVALFLLALGWAFRDWRSMSPLWPAIALEAAAAMTITWGGWLGGILVYRNQIAVDHRYAHAGKWREQKLEGSPGQTVRIDGAEDLKPGQLRLILWNGHRLVLARLDDGYAVFDDRCTHRGGPLSDGCLACGIVQCPWHGSQYDLRTGELKAGPAKEGIRTYKVETRDGRAFLTLPT
jgi:nitrite reductase/ring-hydroxylating ferredoxin subunit/uncharacterized membrane protein